jgi:putative ABC transport system ATP-binding protein
LCGASLLLADEPTGNLDTENGKMVLSFMGVFVREGGGVLMVTHEQSAGEFATRSIAMKDGLLL